MTRTIKITDHKGEKPKTIATVTLDADGKIHCDNSDMLKWWENAGVAGGRDQMQQFFPADGVEFFEALPLECRGLVTAVEENQ